MSLFICENCDTVENTALIHGLDGVKAKEDFPNMSIMDMEGCSDEEIYVGEMGVYEWKQPSEKLMLCSECNTENWHNKFKKEKPTEIEREYAKYSKSAYITQYDHPVDFETFEKLYDSDRYDYFKEKLKWAVDNEEQLEYDPFVDELYTHKEMQRQKINSKILMPAMYSMASMMGVDIPVRGLEPKKPHWKETQLEEDRNKALEKARLKRERKAKIRSK